MIKDNWHVKPTLLTSRLQQPTQAEAVQREVRRICYQMKGAKLPHHKDFATFDYWN